MSKIFDIQTNWEVVYGEDLANILSAKFVKVDHEIEKYDLDEFVDFDNVVSLSKNNSNDFCQLNLNVHHSFKISLLSLVSNCNQFEIFAGKLQEYVQTSYADFIDDFAGTQTYRIDIKFDKNISSTLLKFVTKNTDVWIYGLLGLLQQNTEGQNNCRSINLCNVEQILKETPTIKISENAINCKNFLEKNMNTVKDTVLLNQEFITMEHNLKIKDSNSVKIFNNNQLFSQYGDMEIMAKNYIDHKIEILEQNIMKQIDCKLKAVESRQNEKLDKILTKLDKIMEKIN